MQFTLSLFFLSFALNQASADDQHKQSNMLRASRSVETAGSPRKLNSGNNNHNNPTIVIDPVYVNFTPDFITREISDLTEEYMEDGIDGQDCPQKDGFQSVLGGLSCSGHKCRGLQLKCSYDRHVLPGYSYSTLGFSEEEKLHNCPPNYVITGLKCSGRLCDNIHLQCKELTNRDINYESCDSTSWVSSEVSETFGFVDVPRGGYPIGIECSGAYCEDKRIHYCQV